MDEEKHHLQLCNLVSRGFSLNEARAEIAKAEKAAIAVVHKVAEKVAAATASQPPYVPTIEEVKAAGYTPEAAEKVVEQTKAEAAKFSTKKK